MLYRIWLLFGLALPYSFCQLDGGWLVVKVVSNDSWMVTVNDKVMASPNPAGLGSDSPVDRLSTLAYWSAYAFEPILVITFTIWTTPGASRTGLLYSVTYNDRILAISGQAGKAYDNWQLNTNATHFNPAYQTTVATLPDFVPPLPCPMAPFISTKYGTNLTEWVTPAGQAAAIWLGPGDCTHANFPLMYTYRTVIQIPTDGVQSPVDVYQINSAVQDGRNWILQVIVGDPARTDTDWVQCMIESNGQYQLYVDGKSFTGPLDSQYTITAVPRVGNLVSNVTFVSGTGIHHVVAIHASSTSKPRSLLAAINLNGDLVAGTGLGLMRNCVYTSDTALISNMTASGSNWYDPLVTHLEGWLSMDATGDNLYCDSSTDFDPYQNLEMLDSVQGDADLNPIWKGGCDGVDGTPGQLYIRCTVASAQQTSGPPSPVVSNTSIPTGSGSSFSYQFWSAIPRNETIIIIASGVALLILGALILIFCWRRRHGSKAMIKPRNYHDPSIAMPSAPNTKEPMGSMQFLTNPTSVGGGKGNQPASWFQTIPKVASPWMAQAASASHQSSRALFSRSTTDDLNRTDQNPVPLQTVPAEVLYRAASSDYVPHDSGGSRTSQHANRPLPRRNTHSVVEAHFSAISLGNSIPNSIRQELFKSMTLKRTAQEYGSNGANASDMMRMRADSRHKIQRLPTQSLSTTQPLPQEQFYSASGITADTSRSENPSQPEILESGRPFGSQSQQMYETYRVADTANSTQHSSGIQNFGAQSQLIGQGTPSLAERDPMAFQMNFIESLKAMELKSAHVKSRTIKHPAEGGPNSNSASKADSTSPDRSHPYQSKSSANSEPVSIPQSFQADSISANMPHHDPNAYPFYYPYDHGQDMAMPVDAYATPYPLGAMSPEGGMMPDFVQDQYQSNWMAMAAYPEGTANGPNGGSYNLDPTLAIVSEVPPTTAMEALHRNLDPCMAMGGQNTPLEDSNTFQDSNRMAEQSTGDPGPSPLRNNLSNTFHDPNGMAELSTGDQGPSPLSNNLDSFQSASLVRESQYAFTSTDTKTFSGLHTSNAQPYFTLHSLTGQSFKSSYEKYYLDADLEAGRNGVVYSDREDYPIPQTDEGHSALESESNHDHHDIEVVQESNPQSYDAATTTLASMDSPMQDSAPQTTDQLN